MRIAGFQPLTLLDYPGKLAAVVFTQGCPFRCAYCHNPELLPMRAKAGLGEEDVVARIARRRDFLDGVCVTGGEPTVHPDLPEFLARLKAIGLAVKLDTNGLHPRMIEAIIGRGLADYFAMDLKHVWRRYQEVIGPAVSAVVANCRATQALLASSGVTHEFRTTVWPAVHHAEDLAEIAAGLPKGSRYALQELRCGETFDGDLECGETFDLEVCAARIRAERPDLEVIVRQ